MKLIDKVKILKKMSNNAWAIAQRFDKNNPDDKSAYDRSMTEHMTYDSVITMLIDDDDAKKLAEIYHVEIGE